MRRGFTLLELIVVIVIIAVLMALLCPAVSRVRNAAVLVHCSNNLKQLGMAAHGYRDTHGHFPPGTIPNANLPPTERLSWQVSLLPYLEYQKMYDQFDTGAGWGAPENAAIEKQPTPHQLRCPGYWGPSVPFPFTNYVGIAGIGPDAGTRPLDDPGAGFFGYDRKLKREDVKDGLANTLMVLETGLNVGPLIRGGPATVRPLDLSEDPLLGEGRPFGGLHREDKTLGGTRPLGARALMADASVRLTPLYLEPAVLGALATIAGREDVSLDW